MRGLSRAGIDSFEALTGALQELRGRVGWSAIRLLEGRGRRASRSLLALLAGTNPVVAVEAAKALANLGGVQALRGCARILESDAPVSTRLAAAYALSFMRDDRAAEALVACVLDQEEAPDLRGQAAEGLDFLGREGGPKRGLAVRAALRGLEDPSPTVRFWCAFALGAMPCPSAIKALRKLARRDKAVCPGWWRVCDEAADAIALMEGRPVPERTRRAQA